MHFAYEGFTHEGDRRCFLFRAIEQSTSVSTFLIEVDLSLFVENHVPVQEGPTFCLELLTRALLAGRNCLDRFHKYRVVGEDLRPMLVERERKAAESALKKASHKTFRRPQAAPTNFLVAGKGR